jgi:poly [ADP-ribose] polymerase
MNADKHLVMVTTDNNNKYYDMHDNDDGTFTATWGRIGVTTSNQTYPIKQWNSKFNEKVKKGYTDQSHLFIKPTTTSKLLTISDGNINALVTLLQGYANKSIDDNYTVDAKVVTQAQVNEAQKIMNELTIFVNKCSVDADEVNEKLILLYGVIPRRMSNVKDHILYKDTNPQMKLRLQNFITAEQDTLDVMAGQVSAQAATIQTTKSNYTILDAIGVECKLVEDKQTEQKILKAMGNDANRLLTAYEIVHTSSADKYAKNLASSKNKTTELYWHGSRNENWWSILQTGLLVRPTNAVITGKMFGYGIYGADKFQKSFGYTSGNNSYWARGNQNTAFLGLFEFHMGNTLTVRRHEHWQSELTHKKLRERGDYDSLTALGGADLRNNEFIVYQEEQLTIRYLIKVKG